jgi:cystathionine beta-lyase
VIGFEPVYHMTWEAVELNGRNHISCPLILKDSTYRMDYERLEELCKNPKNKIITVCNPHNPIAKVWGREDLRRIAEVAYKYDKSIYSDEIFADQIYEGIEMLTFGQVIDLPLKVIVATSLGKTFSMTGVGQGNLIISNKELREAFVHQRNIDHYGSFNPMMRVAYLSGYTKEGRDWIREMMKYCWQTYLELEKYLAKYIPQMKPIRPEGSFILWIDCRMFGFEHDILLQELLQSGGLVCDMGMQYGSEPGFIRVNLAAPRREILRVFESFLGIIDH